MPELLNATNPVPGYERSTAPTSVPSSTTENNSQVRNVPDPSRVVRADGRTERQDRAMQDGTGRIRYDSNYQSFLQKLQETPTLTSTLSQLLGGRMGTVVSSGMGDGVAAELSQVMQMLQLDPDQLLKFVTGQFKSSNRFQGALFTLLRQAYANASSERMQTDILQFLRAYLNHSSTTHLEGNILRNLQLMANTMPERWAAKLRDLTAQLENGIDAGDRQGNIALLRHSIIPLMSRYVDATHDMGTPRQLLSAMVLDLARYENGSEEHLLESYHLLGNYGALKNLASLDDQAILQLLHSSSQVQQNDPAQQFADHLAAAASKALSGEGNAENQQLLRQLVDAILINESVYMPVAHYMIPLQWNDRMLFSELWVDPEAQSDTGGGREKTTKFLFKIDVQGVGLFDIILTNQNRNVNLSVSCPESVASFSDQIETALSQILTRNGLTPTGVRVRKMQRPVTLTEVFPKIFERKNSVNVKV